MFINFQITFFIISGVTIRAKISFFSVGVNFLVLFEVGEAKKRGRTIGAFEHFLPRVNNFVTFHVPFISELFVANFATVPGLLVNQFVFL